MWVANLGSQLRQVDAGQQVGSWTQVGPAAEVVAALSEGGDLDKEVQIQLCLKSAMGQDLPSRAEEQILEALWPYAGLLHLPGEALGRTAWVEHHINIEGLALIHQQVRRVPIHRMNGSSSRPRAHGHLPWPWYERKMEAGNFA